MVSHELGEVAKLREQVSELEYRVEQHHRALNEVIEQRDKFLLDAVWGPLKAGAAGVSFIGGFYLSDRFVQGVLDWHGLIAWVVSFVVGFVIAFIGFCLMIAYLDRQQESDSRKLWKLPEWQPRDSND